MKMFRTVMIGIIFSVVFFGIMSVLYMMYQHIKLRYDIENNSVLRVIQVDTECVTNKSMLYIHKQATTNDDNNAEVFFRVEHYNVYGIGIREVDNSVNNSAKAKIDRQLFFAKVLTKAYPDKIFQIPNKELNRLKAGQLQTETTTMESQK